MGHPASWAYVKPFLLDKCWGGSLSPVITPTNGNRIPQKHRHWSCHPIQKKKVPSRRSYPYL